MTPREILEEMRRRNEAHKKIAELREGSAMAALGRMAARRKGGNLNGHVPIRSLYDAHYPSRSWVPGRRWILGAFAVGVALGVAFNVAIARSEPLDQHERHEEVTATVVAPDPPFTTIEDVIRWHANGRGVRAQPIIDLLVCESSLRPDAVGDHGTSWGIAQLSTLPTGLHSHFLSLGYTSAWDSEQAIEYVTRVASGEFLPGRPGAPPIHPWGRISLARWSCWR